MSQPPIVISVSRPAPPAEVRAALQLAGWTELEEPAGWWKRNGDVQPWGKALEMSVLPPREAKPGLLDRAGAVLKSPAFWTAAPIVVGGVVDVATVVADFAPMLPPPAGSAIGMGAAAVVRIGGAVARAVANAIASRKAG